MRPREGQGSGARQSRESSAGPTGCYRIADLSLDIGRRELTRDGERIELGRLTFELLLALVDAAPNVLSHDEIIDRVWRGRATSPETVTQRVKLLRDALSDSAEDPRYIALVRGQGYRLLPVCIAVESWGSRGASRRLSDRPRAVIGASLVLLVAAAAALVVWRAEIGTAGSATSAEAARSGMLPASVAVLPFVNLSPDEENAYFAAGLHDTLLSELAGVSGLNVIARSSVERYADRPTPLQQIARELRVQTVMVGSVQFDGASIRLTATLIQPETQTQLWAQTYDRPFDDIFAIQSDIAIAIAEVLEARLLPSERRSIESPPTTSAAAYALYLETLVDTDRRRLPLVDDRSRLPLLDRALELDPDFAAAYLARAEIHTWAFAYSEAGSSPEEIAKRREYERLALSDAALALEIDPTLPGPWLVRGVLNVENWRWDAAESDFRNALELGPNDPDTLLQSAFFEAYSGRSERAMELARRRFALDPESVESNNGLGFVSIVARDPDTAIEHLSRAARLAPGVWWLYPAAALAYMQQGDRENAETALRTADELRLPGDIGVFLANSAVVYRWLGLTDDARRAFDDFEAWTRENVASEGDWAFAYLGLGDYESMYAALQRAIVKVEANEPDSHQALIYIAANVTDDPVLEEPRFRELRAKLLPSGDLGAIAARQP